jgi:predicted nucleotidyltransferase
MLTKKQIKILNIFADREFSECSFKQIKELSKEKSNSIIQNAIKAFTNEELIKEKTIGTSKLYSLNHENSKVYSYLNLYIMENLPKQAKYSIKVIKELLEKSTYFYSMIIFGSYAINTQKKNSDLDVAVFIEDKNKRKELEASLKSAEMKSFLKIDGHVLTKEEFLDMLKIEQENLGKQISRKHLIVHNPEIFYSLLKEGVKNGYKIMP